MHFGTKLIHNGHEADAATGAVNVPIVQTSTFDQKKRFKEGADAKAPEFEYARSGNPTRKALEETIASLEGGAKGYAFASGVAALSSVLGIFAAGDHVVAAQDIYGGTWRILNTFYKRWGLVSSSFDATEPQTLKKAFRPQTKAVILETPSNPLLKITDLALCIKIAQEAGIISIVDNTFMTPYLQRPLELGADIVIHSATKFLGGHSDVIAGLVVTKSAALGKSVYAVQTGFGGILGPHDAWLVLRGIKTLKVRMDAQQSSAQKIALWLRTHPAVTEVFYPGLPDHPGRTINESQAFGAGAVLSFKTKTPEQALQFLGSIEYAAPAESLGGVETIVSYPVRMSHASMPETERQRLGISTTLVRISVGLEDTDDLIADFDQALHCPSL